MIGPGRVPGQARRIMDFRAETGDEDIRLRDAVALHDAQCGIQAPAGGDTEGRAVAVDLHDIEKIRQ